MTRSKQKIKLALPVEYVWSFVSNINNWAPLIKGYKNHRIINDKQSTWIFHGDVGFVHKTVHLQINITEWKEPTKITFDLIGLSEKFNGSGYFEATPWENRQTIVTTYLQVKVNGWIGPVVNPILKTLLPKTLKELTEAIKREMTKQKVAINIS